VEGSNEKRKRERERGRERETYIETVQYPDVGRRRRRRSRRDVAVVKCDRARENRREGLNFR